MKRRLLLLTALIVLGGAVVGCSHTGSREFVPGKGWVPN